MAEELKVGERPRSRKAPAPKPEVLAAATEEAAKAETFPDNFKEGLALLQEVSAETVSSVEEWDAKQPRLRALKAHVFKLQQGLPVLPSSGDDEAGIFHHRRNGLNRTRLELLGREHTGVKELLADRDALARENEALKLAIETAPDLDALKAVLASPVADEPK